MSSAFCVLGLHFSKDSRAAANDSKVGAIEGVVKFPGETPPRAMFANRGEHDCPHGIPQTHLLVRQENRGLQNAVVWVEAPEERLASWPIVPLQLKGCNFEPRVQWAPIGANLRLENQDPAAHVVRALFQGATAFEVELSDPAQPVRRPLVRPGFYKFNCDRHAWERAWIYVSDHPHVAISDADGHFRLSDLAPGRWTVHVWHEGWKLAERDPEGRLEFLPMRTSRSVTVRRGETADVLLDDLQ